MKKAVIAIGAVFLGIIVLTGAAALAEAPKEVKECFDKTVEKLMSLPEKECIVTLDRRKITIEQLNSYQWVNPLAVVPRKFYYWESDTQETQWRSKRYLAKRYWGPMSVCYGIDKQKRMYGDFAELYEMSARNKPSLVGFLIFLADNDKDGIYAFIKLLGVENPKIDI